MVKIFGIGLNKSGTTTLGAAGKLLGFTTKTWDPDLFQDVMVEGARDRLYETIATHDLFEDFPYPLIYRELDAHYPGAKFILTRRKTTDDWLQSIKAHAMRAGVTTRTHKIVYGFQFPHGREDAFRDFYERHNVEARAYFADRPGDFLDICWEEEESLGRLAAFLGRDAPEAPLPRANARKSKSVNPLRYAFNLGRRLAQNISA